MLKIGSFLTTQGKGLSLLLTMLIGAFIPQAHVFSYLIQYLLMVMLLFAFLDIDLNLKSFHRSVFFVLVANIVVAFVAYVTLAQFNLTFALAAFMTGIAPTAIASPVIISFIDRKVDYVVVSVVLTNIATAFVVPIALPFLIGAQVKISMWDILQPVLIVMLVPFLLSLLVKLFPSILKGFIQKSKSYSFPIWLVNLFIVSAKASDFLRNDNNDSIVTLAVIAFISLVICVLNFSIGALLGGQEYWKEASQALGQKNLAFVIWIALTFINPLVALGPMFYILYHHIYNSWLIYQFENTRATSLHSSGYKSV